jgi:hypothetical protein
LKKKRNRDEARARKEGDQKWKKKREEKWARKNWAGRKKKKEKKRKEKKINGSFDPLTFPTLGLHCIKPKPNPLESNLLWTPNPAQAQFDLGSRKSKAQLKWAPAISKCRK